MNITILGSGAWGTALGRILCLNGQNVTVWGLPDELAEMARTSRNERGLPGVLLPPDMKFEPDWDRALQNAECVLVAVPSKVFRDVTQDLFRYDRLLVSVTKGIEYDSGLTMTGILRQQAPHAHVVALSGPTFALEVAKDMPTAIVAASTDPEAAQTVQQLFHRPSFRVYTSSDPLGVELGGAVKNVVAIAAGVGDGLGFGDNSKAALVTRGIVEMRRLGVACGAQSETFGGLSGIGDLTVTCFSRLSRNRAFGEKLGRGESLDKILAESKVLAEGYPAARSAWQLAKNHKTSTPIIDEVYQLLYENKNVARALLDLTSRESKPE
jgi:glycerol-3-phosphate dehydrogenase (NAD(P)+)